MCLVVAKCSLKRVPREVAARLGCRSEQALQKMLELLVQNRRWVAASGGGSAGDGELELSHRWVRVHERRE